MVGWANPSIFDPAPYPNAQLPPQCVVGAALTEVLRSRLGARNVAVRRHASAVH